MSKAARRPQHEGALIALRASTRLLRRLLSMRNVGADPRHTPVACDDETLLRHAFAVARHARDAGEHPFGCILVDPDGQVVMEQGNAFHAEGGDMTAHAERVLATRAAKRFHPEVLAGFTLYTSAEPCAMCAGALYWIGIGRVVYGQSESDLKRATGAHDENPTLDLPCRTVFAAGQRRVDVVGPLLADEAAALQAGFWTPSDTE